MFEDREDAARELTAHLPPQAAELDIVLAIPRGAVEIGLFIARALNLPLQLLHVAKIGAPGQPELALGAVAADGATWFNQPLVAQLGLAEVQLTALTQLSLAKLAQQSRRYGSPVQLNRLSGKGVLLVDDGAATGATLLAGAMVAASAGASPLGIAVPVASPEAAQLLAAKCDFLATVATPPDFIAVGQYYRNFPQVDDDTVRECLAQSP